MTLAYTQQVGLIVCLLRRWFCGAHKIWHDHQASNLLQHCLRCFKLCRAGNWNCDWQLLWRREAVCTGPNCRTLSIRCISQYGMFWFYVLHHNFIYIFVGYFSMTFWSCQGFIIQIIQMNVGFVFCRIVTYAIITLILKILALVHWDLFRYFLALFWPIRSLDCSYFCIWWHHDWKCELGKEVCSTTNFFTKYLIWSNDIFNSRVGKCFFDLEKGL